MKKRTVKKIAKNFVKGRWYAGEKEPYFWQTTTDGEGYWITEARLPKAVTVYLEKMTLRAGHPWFDSPSVLKLEWTGDDREQAHCAFSFKNQACYV